MIYATGDTHGNFQRFAPEHFPEQAGMTKEDYMLICGDFGGVWDFLLACVFFHSDGVKYIHARV